MSKYIFTDCAITKEICHRIINHHPDENCRREERRQIFISSESYAVVFFSCENLVCIELLCNIQSNFFCEFQWQNLGQTNHKFGNVKNNVKSTFHRNSISQSNTFVILGVSRVVQFSSQYNDNTWSANQVVGPPKVYPRHGMKTEENFFLNTNMSR